MKMKMDVKKFSKNTLNIIKKYYFKLKEKINYMVQQNEGFNVSGYWENIRTGDRIYVRDSVIDGEDMNLVTDRGIISLSELNNDYVQCLDEEVNQKVQAPQIIKEGSEMFEESAYNGPLSLDMPLTPEILNGTSEIYKKEEKEVISKPVEIIKEPEKKNSFEDDLLERVFKNAKNLKVKLVVDWKKVPKAQLEMMSSMFGITAENLGDYIINNIKPETEEVYKFFTNILEPKEDDSE